MTELSCCSYRQTEQPAALSHKAQARGETKLMTFYGALGITKPIQGLHVAVLPQAFVQSGVHLVAFLQHSCC